jgi:uncharacterized surface protein with fasciclin (FAS1) repeats
LLHYFTQLNVLIIYKTLEETIVRFFKFKVVTGLAILSFAVSAIFYANASAQEFKDDIVDTAIWSGNLKTLVKLWQTAGLTETLKGNGPFTVFVSTDEAFAKLPKDALDNLMKSENVEQLKLILSYNVVEGKLLSSDLVKLKSVKTLNGQEIAITVKADTVMVDNVIVKQSDVECRNGVIHVIDTVLFPKEKDKEEEMGNEY